MGRVIVTAGYKFTSWLEYKDYQLIIRNFCEKNSIKGLVLLASEGINCTVAGSPEAIETYKSFLKNIPGFSDISFKDSSSKEIPFNRLKVRLKKEIVTLGKESIDPLKEVGTYIKPKDWNDLISDPEVLLIDTRNDFEVEIGTFKGAINPKTKSFRDFPKFVSNNMDPKRHKKVAMCCTGGIRCEKSTAYMLSQGFEEVYHLEGGILKYLEEVPKEESLWEGSCFVFDKRMALDTGLKLTDYSMCYGCRRPINEHDKKSFLYEEGVCCPKCSHERTSLQKEKARQRHLQEKKAKSKGDKHIGARFF